MAQVIVDAEEVLLDELVRIRVTGLAPGERVRVKVRTEAFKAEAKAEFIADHAGSIDLSSTAPVSGSYNGCDPMGLFWSAQLDEGVDFIEVFTALANLVPLDCNITAEVGRSEVGCAALTRRTLAEGVVRHEVRDGRLRGTFFSPESGSRPGGVVLLGGSDGGNNYEFVAALLAARGIPTLALAWFAYEDLPKQAVEIPLEYFGEAIEWMRVRPEVGARVAVMGNSLGGELALLLGATFADVAAVVAIVPSGVLWGPKWMHRGTALPGIPGALSDPETMKAIQEAIEKGTPASGTPGYLWSLEAAGTAVEDAQIPVERTRGPILLLSGEDDAMWPSKRLADIAVDRLKSCGFRFAFDHLSYPGAGHLAFLPPYVPTTRNWVVHPQLNIPVALGGNARDTASAGADAWPRIIEFLRAGLSGSEATT